MRLGIAAIAITATTMICGCDKSGSNSRIIPSPTVSVDSINTKYQGVWTAPGYAQSIVIGEHNVDIYQHTSSFCLHTEQSEDVSTADIESVVRETESNNQLEWYLSYGTASFSAPGIQFERRAALPLACKDNLISIVEDSENPLDVLELWEFYGQIIAEYYLDFDQKNIDWQQVYYNAGIELNGSSTASDLFLAMEETLVSLADTHNYIQSPQGWFAKTLTKPTLTERLVEEYAMDNGIPFPLPQELITESIASDIYNYVTTHQQYQWELVADYAQQSTDIKTAANGLIRWFEREEVGYLFLGGMLGYADAEQVEGIAYAEQTLEALNVALDSALHDLRNVNGLIIDVRTNDGGHDFVSLAIASRFMDSTTHVYSKQARDGSSRTPLQEVFLAPYNGLRYSGPITLLTSASTVSAAETFALIMSQFSNVTLIGEPSQGVFSDVMEWTLPNGFNIGLSNEFYFTPDGEWYEGQGVPVDITVPFYTLQQREVGIDLGIETAFMLLTE